MATPPLVASPCIGVCTMDAASGWCAGCLRTLDEIAAWSQLPEAAKRAVWVQLSARRVAWRRRHQAQPPATADDGGAP
jgi:predicted Fe-S protein YdhL (DUF1289 family)